MENQEQVKSEREALLSIEDISMKLELLWDAKLGQFRKEIIIDATGEKSSEIKD